MGLNGPQGLAFDATGNLYVANYWTNSVEKFSPTGSALGVFASAPLNGPEDLVFDPDGNLYVASFGTNSVEEFSSTGVYLGSFAAGVNGPTGLAVRVK
jgi:DNA-binding beta-propeller fold protein YncE